MALTKAHNRMIEGAAVNVKDFGAVGDGVTDDTTAIQAAIDAVSNNGGGEVYIPNGVYAVNNLIAKEGVTLFSNNIGPVKTATAIRKPYLKLNATGSIIKTTSDTNNFSVVGLFFDGGGVSGDTRGIILGSDSSIFSDSTTHSATKFNLFSCTFNNFQREGVLAKNTGALRMRDCFTQNCLLDATYLTQQRAACAIYGNDSRISGCEFASLPGSATGVTSANLYAAALGLFGGGNRANSFVEETVGELSDVGIYCDQKLIRLVNVRCDQNFGHGFVFDQSRGQLANCTAYANGQDTTNTYDGFHVKSGINQIQFSNCLADSQDVTNKHRYGFFDESSANTAEYKNSYDSGCRSFDHATQAFYTPNGVSIQTPYGEEILFSDGDTTPDVDGWGAFRTANTSATTITNFDNGFIGQVLRVRINDSNTTIGNGATIKTGTGTNVNAVVNSVAEFVKQGSVWYLTNRASIV